MLYLFRCKVWVEACGHPELLQQFTVNYIHKNLHVCDLHFKPSDRNRKKLKKNATPFPYNQTPMETKSTQTDNIVVFPSSDSDTDIENSPSTSTASKATRKGIGARKSSQLKRLQDKLKRLQTVSDCGLRSELFKLIHFQTQLDKFNKDKECAENFRLYALNLYLANPRTYSVLRSSLSLPSEKVLRQTNPEIDTVMSYRVIMNLKAKMDSFKPTDRYCTVCLKKMPLKRFLFYHINRDKVIGFRNINGDEIMEPATEVYVLMARGLNAKWEQPLAYCFLGENDVTSNIDSWLCSVLDTLIGMGFDVVALVIDHEDLYDHFRSQINSFTQPYIHINSQIKIYCIFDLPQLIISLRNTLMIHKLQFQDDDGSLVIADWGVIETLCSKNDENNAGILVSKLTNSHIRPNESEKKELKYAAEVFSKSVAEALDMEYKMRVEYDSRIRGTQKLMALVNDVFDILNSSAHNHHNKCKNAFTGEPYQMRAIRKFMEFLTNVKPLNDFDAGDTSFNCIYGLRISIMSFSIILRDLLPKGINSLVTHRFNLNGIDKFFDFVRQKSKSEKPTAVQFYKYFRKKYMVDLMKHPKTPNPADNLLKFLNRIDIKKQMTRSKMKSEDFKKTIEVHTVDYRFEMPQLNSFNYMCWYLLKKCYEVHDPLKCDQLSRLLHDNVIGINWKFYNWDKYFKPPDIFIDFIKRLDEKLDKHFGNRLEVGLGTGILLVLKDLRCGLLCPCFPINYLRRLFVRLRIFNIIRYNNKRLSEDSFHFSSTILQLQY